MAPFGPGGDGVEAGIDNSAPRAGNARAPGRCRSPVENFSPGGIFVEPAQEQRSATPSSRCASRSTADSASFLIALEGGSDRVFDEAGIADALDRGDPGAAGAVARSSHDMLVGGAELAQIADQMGEVGDAGDAIGPVPEFGRDLSRDGRRVSGGPDLRHDGETEQPGTLNYRAAHVEQTS